jgi:hypothetical protein
VRVRLDLKAGAGRGSLDHPGEAGRRERRPALADEDEGRGRALAAQPSQRPQLVAKVQRVVVLRCRWDRSAWLADQEMMAKFVMEVLASPSPSATDDVVRVH